MRVWIQSLTKLYYIDDMTWWLIAVREMLINGWIQAKLYMVENIYWLFMFASLMYSKY